MHRLKIAEAAGDMQEDEHVYRTLNPPGGLSLSAEITSRFTSQIEFMLAVAEVNTGRRDQAMRRLEALQQELPGVENYLVALRAGKPGLGWTERFPYVNYLDIIPSDEIETFVDLVTGQEDLQERRFRRQVEQFVKRYPQIVLLAEKVIWEAELPDLGIPMLVAIATPAAGAALRRFALSQAGKDEARMRALSMLKESGGFGSEEWVQVWLDGAWEKVRMREYELVEGPAFEYSEQVADLLNDGLAAMQAGDDEQAERLYRQALELEPGARQAYNNLGAIYRNRGEKARARKMFESALEIDPTYVFPRCTLANDLIDAQDLEGAEEILSPLRDVTCLQPAEMSFYCYTQARILIGQSEYDEARRALKAALRFTPDYEPAQELIERIDIIVRLQTGFASLREQTQARRRSTRARLQAKLSTPAPTLAQVLPLYTKDALTGMARVVLPSGGWSALRKAELIDEIVARFQETDNLRRIVDQLEQEDRAALHQVLADGGNMAWTQFDAAYGNDLDESPYGNFERSKTAMGRLRGCGFLVETTVDGELRIAVPLDLRAELGESLGVANERKQ
jgi:tetratricopeptide (TPR) repeat protein